jgi:L-seryl-tRNA(Ser) seleniumtransferase
VRERPPSIDALARSIPARDLPAPLRVDAARAAVADGRADEVARYARALADAMLRPVVNATGVLLHTNLGRAPFALATEAAYTNLELDLESGRRGDRRERAGSLLARACGAEAALVVNNGAAAVLLVLAALARGGSVAVSRGELVEIGGGFRIPEVMRESGARLVEVGTTNRTRLADYAAVAGDVALMMKVHRSNYQITGFTEEASVTEVARLGVPLVVDLGSGLLDAACPWLPDGPPPWLSDEPAVRQTLADGAALVVCSGDKLLGGPQAGVIAGAADLIDRCARHPLYRALRPGGHLLAGVQAVALAYLERDVTALPFWRMATEPVERLRERAAALGQGEVVQCSSIAGGGTLPGIEIPSAGIALDGDLTGALRAQRPMPVIARVDHGRTILDLRTVDPAQDPLLAAALDTVTTARR